MERHSTFDIRHSNINEAIICAGFGGQGVMVLGKFLATAGMKKDLNVTWFPSYGAEVRGGTAHSFVRISSEPIANPNVTLTGTAIIMNEPSLRKFEKNVEAGGLIILNTSMCDLSPARRDIEVVKAPLTDEAIALGNIKVANMMAAGIYAAKKGMFDMDVMKEVIKEMAGKREGIISVNLKAIEKGIEIVGSSELGVRREG